MKTALFFSTVISFFCFQNQILAQIPAGTFRIGPDISFSSNKLEIDGLDLSVKNSSFELGTYIGYYVIDNLEVTVGLGFFSTKAEIDNQETSTNGFIIGPNLEYKIGLSTEWYFGFGAGLRFNSATEEDTNGDEFKLTGITYHAFAGIEYIINNKLGAFISVGPEFGSLKEDETEVEFDVSNLGLGMGFGFYF